MKQFAQNTMKMLNFLNRSAKIVSSMKVCTNM